jgi:hypothetical protein
MIHTSTKDCHDHLSICSGNTHDIKKLQFKASVPKRPKLCRKNPPKRQQKEKGIRPMQKRWLKDKNRKKKNQPSFLSSIGGMT